MHAGAYRHKIEIQKNTPYQDGIGNPKSNWEKFREIYAYVNGLSGNEYWEAAALHAETTLEVVTRWKPFYKEMNSKGYRIVFENEFYDILSIDNIQFNNKIVKMRVQKNG